GGGIEVVNGSVVLTDSALNENEAGPVGSANPGNGGGLHVTGSATVFVTNTEVIGNVAANEGGGLWNQAGSTMYVNMGSYIGFNLVTGLNANDGGGGIFNNMGSLSISDSTLDRNAANGSGGGVFNNGGSVSIVRSTLSGNFAGSASSAGGGGLFNSSGADARIVNSTFSGNTANHNGGGIENFGSVSIFNSTLVLNRANEDALGAPNGGSGGGIHTLSGAFTELYNTIVAGNRRFANTVDDDINGGMVFAGSSFNIVGNAVTSGGLTDAVNSNIVGVGGIGTRALATIVSPTLGDNGGPTLTHALVAGSVGINSGGVGFLPAGVTTDQRGFPRLNGILDRGAFEL
ncbi:MAG: hypothetical protein KDA80_18720, partial [Planctomycetaceae bacterium]|nr:hypothetical protein [Planctomycetaceae bacterium]